MKKVRSNISFGKLELSRGARIPQLPKYSGMLRFRGRCFPQICVRFVRFVRCVHVTDLQSGYAWVAAAVVFPAELLSLGLVQYAALGLVQFVALGLVQYVALGLVQFVALGFVQYAALLELEE